METALTSAQKTVSTLLAALQYAKNHPESPRFLQRLFG
ncbi:hypothetical protein AcdelDRAFT_3064 [Acidovorax delafieldii 2AN]|uniref:Uncharacterized protein n=1 Tax=Acidovorax delafieldii 2AN TaxID=573060 RepID=C5T834_ACIDE|nr:hypothetical protein AcdelDRAFT_3064 [Acidovorax delafieldii 2AN]